METKEIGELRAILNDLVLGFEFVSFNCTSSGWFGLSFRRPESSDEIELRFSDIWWMGDRSEWTAELEKLGLEESALKAQKLAGFALLQPKIERVELETFSVSIHLGNGGILTSICPEDGRQDLRFIDVSDCHGETLFEYSIPVGGPDAVWLAEKKVVNEESELMRRRVLQILQRGMTFARSHAYGGEYSETHRYLTYIEAIPNLLINWGEGGEQQIVDELERVNATWFLLLLESTDPNWGLPESAKIPLAKSVSIYLLELVGRAIKSSLKKSETIEHQAEIANLMDALEQIPFNLSGWNQKSARFVSSCLAVYPDYLAEFESLFE